MFRQSLRSIARANKVSLTRGYAEAASSDVLKLSFTLPHEVSIYISILIFIFMNNINLIYLSIQFI